jgi:hypothetical protein
MQMIGHLNFFFKSYTPFLLAAACFFLSASIFFYLSRLSIAA